MTDRTASTQYWRYQPPESLVMGDPDWLQRGCCYEGEVLPGATGFVLLFEPDGEGIHGVDENHVEQEA